MLVFTSVDGDEPCHECGGVGSGLELFPKLLIAGGVQADGGLLEEDARSLSALEKVL